MQLVCVTAPDPIITVAEAKRYLVVEHNDHDLLIEAFVQGAQAYVEGPNGFVGRALGPQTWDMTLSAFEFWTTDKTTRTQGQRLEIPLPPLIGVDEVEYRNKAGDLTAWTNFTTHGIGAASIGFIRPALNTDWPDVADAGDAFRVRFRCGYGVDNQDSPPSLVEAVPHLLKLGILAYAAEMHRTRGTSVIGQRVTPLPWAAEQLLRPYRVPLSFA